MLCVDVVGVVSKDTCLTLSTFVKQNLSEIYSFDFIFERHVFFNLSDMTWDLIPGLRAHGGKASFSQFQSGLWYNQHFVKDKMINRLNLDVFIVGKRCLYPCPHDGFINQWDWHHFIAEICCVHISIRPGALVAMTLLAPPTASASSLIIYISTTAGPNLTKFSHIHIHVWLLHGLCMARCRGCAAFVWDVWKTLVDELHAGHGYV